MELPITKNLKELEEFITNKTVQYASNRYLLQNLSGKRMSIFKPVLIIERFGLLLRPLLTEMYLQPLQAKK